MQSRLTSAYMSLAINERSQLLILNILFGVSFAVVLCFNLWAKHVFTLRVPRDDIICDALIC